MSRRGTTGLAVLSAALLAACLVACEDEARYAVIAVTCPAFGDEQTIPIRHTCDGDDLSPPLGFAGVPDETVGLAVIMEEPEAEGGRFTHWLLWGIPAGQGFLGEGVAAAESPGGGVAQGTNDAETIGYSGPCPEEEDDDEHRYVLRVYALDRQLALEPGAGRKALDKAMNGHVVGYGKLVGYYEREQ